jgi:hypothetical protein
MVVQSEQVGLPVAPVAVRPQAVSSVPARQCPLRSMQPWQTKGVPLLDVLVLVPPLPLPVPLLPPPLLVPLELPPAPFDDPRWIPEDDMPPFDPPPEAPPSSPPRVYADPPVLELHACRAAEAVKSRPARPKVTFDGFMATSLT